MRLLRPRHLFLSRTIVRGLSSSQFRVCIVGSGPAAFYTAQCILKAKENVHVDVLEMLPVPFGLVRYGVAPDHPEVKNVINTFTQVAKNERFSFFGNVSVGSDVTVERLRKTYSAVVLAYGAAKDKMLDIPGENLPGVLSARDFVGWYNGLPQNAELQPNLDVETAVIFGHGNVALDVARILVSPNHLLAHTDIPAPVLDVLARSRVRRVVLVGRRGPLQASFTTKEVREMLKLPDCRPDIEHAGECVPELLDPEFLQTLPRPRRRLTELLVRGIPPLSFEGSSLAREWSIRYLRSPLEVLPTPDGSGVAGVRLGINEFVSDFVAPDAKVRTTDRSEVLSCGLVLRSIGYRCTQLDPSVPFDDQRGVIPNERGHVEANLFCAGWIKRGPSGVLLTTLSDGKETGAEVLGKMRAGHLEAVPSPQVEQLHQELVEKGAVSFCDWERIDAVETHLGANLGKPREKLTSVPDLLAAAKRTDL